MVGKLAPYAIGLALGLLLAAPSLINGCAIDSQGETINAIHRIDRDQNRTDKYQNQTIRLLLRRLDEEGRTNSR